jgi:hypothetical protein
MRQDTRIGWLADEIPLVDRRLRVTPFPLSPRVDAAATIPWPPAPIDLGEVYRTKQPPKKSISIDALASRIAKRAPLAGVFLCRRVGVASPRIRPAGRLEAARRLARFLLMGKDLPQTKGYTLPLSPRALAIRGRTLLGRAVVVARILRKVPVHRFEMSSDRRANALAVASYLRQTCGIESEIDGEAPVPVERIPSGSTKHDACPR